MPREQEVDDLRPGRLVEIAGRLVGDEDGRVRRERAGERHALLLAAGQLGRVVLPPLAQAHGGKLARGALLRVVDTGKLQRHGDVFQRRHGGNEMEGLKHDADIAPAEARQRVLAERTERFAGDHDRAGIGALQTGHDHQQGRFAGARRADEPDRLAASYMQVDVFEDMNTPRAPSERQVDAAERDRRARAPQPRGILHVRSLFAASGRGGAGAAPVIWGLGGAGPDGRAGCGGAGARRAGGRARPRGRSSGPHRSVGRLAHCWARAAGRWRVPGKAREGTGGQGHCGGAQQRRRRRPHGDRDAGTGTGALARLDWSLPDGTDAVIVELGANDMLRGIDPNVTRAALAEIVRRLTERRIAVLLAGMRAVPNLGPDYGRDFEAIYSELAARNGLLLYPFFLDGVAPEARLNQRDGLHPTADGVDVIVARILPKVEELVGRVRQGRM